MMEYARAILPEVCIWEYLFKKELLKCVSWASFNELNELNAWCHECFNEMYPELLNEVFNESVSMEKSMAITL